MFKSLQGLEHLFFLSHNRNIYYCGKANNKNISNIPVKFNIFEKNSDISNDLEFSVVRIMSTYSLYKSIFYASIADVRNIFSKYKNQHKINEILDILAENWLNEKKRPPFIPEIARFFDANYMKMDG